MSAMTETRKTVSHGTVFFLRLQDPDPVYFQLVGDRDQQVLEAASEWG